MSELSRLPTPALLLDLDRVERNVLAMAGRAEALGVTLRPHVKTHKCVELARLQADAGARGLTVATLEEARTFAAAGFSDLTWAFPLIVGRLAEAAELSETAVLRLVVDSPEAIDAVEGSSLPFHVWLKVDCGYGRAGVDPEDPRAVELARRLAASDGLAFDGLLTHSGQAYGVRGRDALRAVAEIERRALVDLADRLRADGVRTPRLSVGSTPAMSAAESLSGVDEARPGNYVFHDAMQTEIGSCGVADCALTVLASVVSSPAGSRQSVVDAGALALSKDPGLAGSAHGYGAVFDSYDEARLSPEVRVSKLSQEHGILSGRLAVGSRVRILPQHSCLTAACFDSYWVVRGDRVVDRWRIERGR